MLRKGEEEYELFVSGAPEEVLSACRAMADGGVAVLDEETAKGRRVIAVAYKKLPILEEPSDLEAIEQEMDFVGLINFEDPPRRDVRETLGSNRVPFPRSGHL